MVFIFNLHLYGCKGRRDVFWNTILKPHKNYFDQKTPNHEIALSFVLPREYHDLATRFCGSKILQVFNFESFFKNHDCVSPIQVTFENLIEKVRYLIFVVQCIMLNSEIIPTRCNNCVYSSQWLYSTCFGLQFHPSSGVQCCI